MKEAVEAVTIAHAGKISTLSGVGGATASWTLSDIGILVGIGCAVLGFIVPLFLSWYFQSKRLKIYEKESRERIRIANTKAGLYEKAITQYGVKREE